MVQYKCPECRFELESPDDMADQTHPCPECGATVRVPPLEAPGAGEAEEWKAVRRRAEEGRRKELAAEPPGKRAASVPHDTIAMSRNIDPRHTETRRILRIVGPSVIIVGLIFTAIGFGSFFSSMGTFEQPSYFLCVFVGFPLIGLGGMICKFAFMGAIKRYMANEVAPVGKDVVNYMADGTKDAVRDVAAAVGAGLRDGAAASEVRILRCHKCNTDNEAPASFCKGCGAPLAKTKPCASCGELNDPDARFCDNCGKPIA